MMDASISVCVTSFKASLMYLEPSESRKIVRSAGS